MSAPFIIPVNPHCSCDLSVDEPCPVHPVTTLTKADILAAVKVLKDAGFKDPVQYILAPEMLNDSDIAALIAGEPLTSSQTPDPKPRQEPLFIIPPPCVPSGWSIEWKWRAHEIEWTTGKQKNQSWNYYGTWRDFGHLKREMRRVRYTDSGKRKQFRYRVTLWDYRGDIQWNGPPPAQLLPTKPTIPF